MVDVASTTANDKVLQTLQRLRHLNQVSVLQSWRIQPEALTHPDFRTELWQNWEIAAVNAKDQITWQRGRTQRVLVQTVIVPEQLQGYAVTGLKLYLALTWWAELAEIWVNGKLVQAGDLFDCSARILLTPTAQPRCEFQVALSLVSPGHDPGALVRSLLMFESPDDSAFLEPSFIADEWQGLYTYLQAFAPEKLPEFTQCLNTVAFPKIAHAAGNDTRQPFDQHLSQLRQQLQPLAESIRQRQMHLVGHAHLDLAWLWPIPDTWDAAERTFKSVLSLQNDFPELTFTHSSPALFEWLETHRPALFAEIQAKVAAGTFEIAAGLWVEPDLNLIDGESIVRQILYGQRYTQAKFGRISPIAWVPDTFGFCWQLPQLLRQGGVDYFVTQKLRWNDTTKFPYDAFWWVSPDGTAIFTLMSALIGQEINPVKMTDYAWDWQQKTHIPESLWLPGVGDHGGGPTRDMLETARRWENSPFFPQMKFSTVLEYLQQLPGSTANNPSSPRNNPAPDFPIWQNELYLEFHRGCYTTHADQKQFNRRSECLLYQAELFASLATLVSGCNYPQSQLTAAWKGILFNQFHDILPGSSIPEVYTTANQIWSTVMSTGQVILDQALATLTQQIQLPELPVEAGEKALPIAIFNPLSWQRTEVVAVANPDARIYQILDESGKSLPVQHSNVDSVSKTLFLAQDLPSIGYQVFWLCPTETSIQPIEFSTGYVLENDFLRVEIDPLTGDIVQIGEKSCDRHSALTQHRNVLRAPGNQLQFFQDQGQYWDAWNIDPNYAQHPLPAATLESIQWLESGHLRQRIRVVRRFQSSRFQQDYVLDCQSPCLKIQTIVDWQERHVLVKAAFPLDLEQAVATYEIPFAAIARPNYPETPAEKAMWEVPALRWADLGNAEFGVSLLNDCKYGYDCQGTELRLTLLRGSEWPNPDADLGMHEFTYALFPHCDRWQAVGVVHQGHVLNQPLLVRQLQDPAAATQTNPRFLPTTGQFLNPFPENLVLAAWKQSESEAEQWILRCYEAHGQSAILNLDSALLTLTSPQRLNLLETPLPLSNDEDRGEIHSNSLTLQPWQICSIGISIVNPIG